MPVPYHGLGFDPLSAAEFNQLFSLFNFYYDGDDDDDVDDDGAINAHGSLQTYRSSESTSILRISMNTSLFMVRDV